MPLWTGARPGSIVIARIPTQQTDNVEASFWEILLLISFFLAFGLVVVGLLLNEMTVAFADFPDGSIESAHPLVLGHVQLSVQKD